VGETALPWLGDRLFRHLLTDLTGNTHRAEFCIDKLYSPYGAAGRQGLLEFRGFEMPPHARMAMVQSLLLRALVARFWQQPYRQPLARWGASLHDRFLLPYFVRADVRDVCAQLEGWGYPLLPDWFEPFFEFRFPLLGQFRYRDVQFQLRQAIEPWHVLGEEVGSQGVARYVDSSLDRVEVRLSGMEPGRFALACNGRRVPLVATATAGEYVAGVRFRAWQPWSALHPTIGVHAPLRFDLIDLWTGKAVAWASYHVAHPGGRAHEDAPVNGSAAEWRRLARLEAAGHTPGAYTPPPAFSRLSGFFPDSGPPRPMAPPPEEAPPEYPTTLDLRRPRRSLGY